MTDPKTPKPSPPEEESQSDRDWDRRHAGQSWKEPKVAGQDWSAP